MWAYVLAALLMADSPLRVLSEAPQVDATSVREGLEMRLGERAQGWSVLVLHTPSPETAHVRLTSPEGAVVERDLRLPNGEVETKSRSLAAAVALIIEQHEPAAVEPTNDANAPETPPNDRVKEPVLGYLAVAGELSLTRSYDIGGGLGLWGGTWLLRRHLQPIAGVSWIHARREDLKVDAVRLHLGLLGGAEPAANVWLGGGVIMGLQWLHASAEGSDRAWSSLTKIPVVAQFRFDRFLLGLSTGPELLLPPVRARSDETVLRLSPVRFFVALSLGGVFGGSR